MNSTGTTQAANPLDGITAAIESAIQQAREQADTIINDARAEAEQIVADARAEAEQIIADAGAQADARARDDMERASLAIQEHAAALHTLALGLTGHETTPNANNADDNATSGEGDDSADSSDAYSADNGSNVNEGAIPPAPTATPTATVNDSAPTHTSRATSTPHTARRADGTTRKLAPWEQPTEPQEEPNNKPVPVTGEAPTTNSAQERTNTTESAATPTWDAPLIIDAPLQL